jgi:hypothetical protein
MWRPIDHANASPLTIRKPSSIATVVRERPGTCASPAPLAA